jgi:hypothetical protein
MVSPIASANEIFNNLMNNNDTNDKKPVLYPVNNCCFDNLPEIKGVNENNETDKLIEYIKNDTSDIHYYYQDFMTHYLVGYMIDSENNNNMIKNFIIFNYTYFNLNINRFKILIESIRRHRTYCANNYYKQEYDKILKTYSADYIIKNCNYLHKKLLYSVYGFYYGYREKLNNIIAYYITLIKNEIKKD